MALTSNHTKKYYVLVKHYNEFKTTKNLRTLKKQQKTNLFLKNKQFYRKEKRKKQIQTIKQTKMFVTINKRFKKYQTFPNNFKFGIFSLPNTSLKGT